MRDVYSIYDAKAHLSQLLKRVKAGKEIVISERGTPIVKMVPISQEQNFSERLVHLKSLGVILPRKNKKQAKGLSRPGALKRFLKDRE